MKRARPSGGISNSGKRPVEGKKKQQIIGKTPKFDDVTKARLDEDEAKLEALVFGGGITRSSHTASSSSAATASTAAPSAQNRGASKGRGGRKASGAAWEDEDDRHISVDIAATSRLRKLRQAEDEFEVSGKEYAKRLRERHQSAFLSKVTASSTTGGAATLLGGAASSDDVDGWAVLPSVKRRRKNAEKKERKAASQKKAWGDDDEDESSDDDSSSDSDDDEDSDSSSDSDSFVSEEEGHDEDDDEEEEEALLRGASSVLAKDKAKKTGESSGPLASGTISVTRVRDANRSEPSKAVIQAVQFHHQNSVLFTAGLDHKLRFFAVDGKKNPKVASVFFPDLPITAAAWSYDGNEVICSGRRPFYYSYDCGSGSAVKIPRILGRDEKSLESMVVQQPSSVRSSSSSSSLAVSGGADCPPLISFLGNDGTIILVSQRTKTWVSNLKMNGSVRAACFTKPWLSSPGTTDGSSLTGWSDLLTVGGEGEVYRWDLRMLGKCLYRHQDEGLSSGTAIAASHDGRLYAVGSTSGVVNVYDCSSSDIQRRYSTWASLAGASAGAGAGGADELPTALTGAGSGLAAPKPLYSSMLLTTSISHLAFSPGKSEILSIGSQKITDSYRLIHTATGKAFGNWPTAGTPLHYVTCSAYSPRCGYVAIGNDRGRVLLYRLNHYEEA
jgi:U3 small nucleolar RNA-associated protein 18